MVSTIAGDSADCGNREDEEIFSCGLHDAQLSFEKYSVTKKVRHPRLNQQMQRVMQSNMIFAETRVNVVTELDDIDALVTQYWARVLRYVSFSINDTDLANSITQDCFLKAFNGRASFRGDCAVSTWLMSIATNLVRDQVRLKKFQFWRKAHATSIDVTEMASFLPSSESSAEAKLLARERLDQVKTALDHISVNQRRVFLLRFFEGMDLEEISQVTGMPVNTVKTHLHRGISAIRARIGGKA